MTKGYNNRRVVQRWYRSIAPDGHIWTESRSKDEILSEAKKWDGPGDLRMQALEVVQEESGWYGIPWPEGREES